MKEQEDVVNILRRTFKGGPMRRLPKKREDADVLLALSLVGLDAEGIFDESDINLHLSAWLADISDDGGSADYVTIRRYLVDFGFLRRASDGLVYRVRGERVDEVLAASAKQVNPKQVFAEVTQERVQRRSGFQA
jgi:hypothetical protein